MRHILFGNMLKIRAEILRWLVRQLEFLYYMVLLRHIFCLKELCCRKIAPIPNTVLYLNHYKRNEVVTYAQNERQQEPSQNQYYASQIAEKQESITSLTAEIASITANIDTLKADLKEKKTALKKAEKEVATLEAKKLKADAKAAEDAKKAEAESVVKKLLASGMSADEILEKLK